MVSMTVLMSGYCAIGRAGLKITRPDLAGVGPSTSLAL